MNATTVGVDLAKTVFAVAVADENWGIVARHRLSRARFAQFFVNHPRCRIVMEACGSAHHWARTLRAQGHEPLLLPAQHVRAYVRRNKTDAADAAALIEAARCAELQPVPIKSIEQQVIQQLHRMRSQCMGTRTARINLLRGTLREFGLVIPVGVARGRAAVREALANLDNGLPDALRPLLIEILGEIADLEQRVDSLERQLRELTREDSIVRSLMSIPGIGLLTATALRAAIVDIQRFPSGRHLASWLGLTAREHSSAERRHLGRISKRGDVYLRTLLVHGARAVLYAAKTATRTGRPLDRLRAWALAIEQRAGHNKATVALANKLARIAWATWRHGRAFNGNWVAAH
ncbi:MAG: IS110 family transposase [Dongiaceae bacterium]